MGMFRRYWVGCGLATCASAAGDHAGARTNLRSLAAPSEGAARAAAVGLPARRLNARARRQRAAALQRPWPVPPPQPSRLGPYRACSRERLARSESPGPAPVQESLWPAD